MKRLSLGWKVLLATLLLSAGFFAGHAAPRQADQSSPMPPLAGSGAGGRGSQAAPPPKAVDGQGMYWSIDDLRKNYAASANATAQAHLAWTPEYRLTIFKRPYATPATAGAEMHEDKTQIYFIFAGTGTQVLGGQPAKDTVEAEGQHNAMGPLAGGKSFRVKPGDVVLIPPMTWHQTLPDEGQTIVYAMVHLETRTRIP